MNKPDTRRLPLVCLREAQKHLERDQQPNVTLAFRAATAVVHPDR